MKSLYYFYGKLFFIVSWGLLYSTESDIKYLQSHLRCYQTIYHEHLEHMRIALRNHQNLQSSSCDEPCLCNLSPQRFISDLELSKIYFRRGLSHESMSKIRKYCDKDLDNTTKEIKTLLQKIAHEEKILIHAAQELEKEFRNPAGEEK